MQFLFLRLLSLFFPNFNRWVVYKVHVSLLKISQFIETSNVQHLCHSVPQVLLRRPTNRRLITEVYLRRMIKAVVMYKVLVAYW